MRLLWLAALALGMAATLPLKPARAETPAIGHCTGSDMMAELKTADPEAYKKLIETAENTENGKALFWKIEKSGIAPSYMFGTMHVSDKRITTLPDTVAKIIEKSKTIVLEVADLSPEAMAAAMLGASQHIFYSDGRSLADQLSADEFKTVQSIAAGSGIPGDFAKLLRPWLVSTLLSASDCERQQVAQGAPVLDLKISALAKSHQIPVRGLETAQEQLLSLSGVPEDQQIKILKAGLKYADRRDDLLETVAQMYLKRQMGAAMPFQILISEKFGYTAADFAGFEKALLVDRNARMKDRALPILEKGSAFIAVGALHLPGKTGLVSLLRDAGYTVTSME